MYTTDIQFEEVKLWNYKLTYIWSQKFKDARQTINPKSFQDKLRSFKSNCQDSDSSNQNSKIVRLTYKLMKYPEEQNVRIMNKIFD